MTMVPPCAALPVPGTRSRASQAMSARIRAVELGNRGTEHKVVCLRTPRPPFTFEPFDVTTHRSAYLRFRERGRSGTLELPHSGEEIIGHLRYRRRAS